MLIALDDGSWIDTTAPAPVDVVSGNTSFVTVRNAGMTKTWQFANHAAAKKFSGVLAGRVNEARKGRRSK